MSQQVRFVLSAFFRLSAVEKEQVVEQIQHYLSVGIPIRNDLEEQISVVLQPRPFGCPICRG
jgi:hypothetical protein